MSVGVNHEVQSIHVSVPSVYMNTEIGRRAGEMKLETSLAVSILWQQEPGRAQEQCE